MKKLISFLTVVTLLVTTTVLTGCGGNESENTANTAAAQETPEDWRTIQVNELVFAVPDSDWSDSTDHTYTFLTDRGGNYDENISLEFCEGYTEKSLESYWQWARENDYIAFGSEELIGKLMDSGKTTVDGRDCYWYDILQSDDSDTDMWFKVMLIPQSDANRYLEIRADFIYEQDKKDADQLFQELLDGMTFTDSDRYEINESTVTIGETCVPANGFSEPKISYYVDVEEPEAIALITLDDNGKEYCSGFEPEDTGTLTIDGIETDWENTVQRTPEGATLVNYSLLIPCEDGDVVYHLDYAFDGEGKSSSDYEDLIQKLTEQIHIK